MADKGIKVKRILQQNLPSTISDIENIHIFYTEKGTQYINDSNGNVIKVSDIKFVNMLPISNIQTNCIYVLNNSSMHLWDGIQYHSTNSNILWSDIAMAGSNLANLEFRNSQDLNYDNSISGLTATNAKTALDELTSKTNNKVDKVVGKSLISDTEISRLSTVTNFNKDYDELINKPNINGKSLSGNVVLDKTDIGLSNVDNTIDINKNVLSATKLTTARTITLNGDIAGNISFDGSQDVTINSTIPKLGNKANGIPLLDSSAKLDKSVLPALAISNTIVANSEAEMLASNTTMGDICVRHDLHQTFILQGEDHTILSNWLVLDSPTDQVSSVAGKTGVVTLTKDDVGLSNVDNTRDVDKPISTVVQSVLNSKSTKSTVIAYYVNATTGLDTNDGLTNGTAFKTLQKAINMLPDATTQDTTINVADGTYDESVTINNKTGVGASLIINGNTTNPSNVKLGSITANGFNGNGITIQGFEFTVVVTNINVTACSNVNIKNCVFQTSSTKNAVVFKTSSGIVDTCTISNRNGINCNNSNATVINCTGTNVKTYLISLNSSIISYIGTIPTCTTLYNNDGFGIVANVTPVKDGTLQTNLNADKIDGLDVNDTATGEDATTNNAIWSANKVKKIIDAISTSGGSGGHIIKNDSTTFTQRTNLKFTGSGITVSDDSSTNSTVINIEGGSGSVAKNVIGLKAIVSAGASKITLSFKIPDILPTGDYLGREIYMSENDLTQMDRTACSTNANVTLLNSGVGTGVNTNDSYDYTISSNLKNKLLYFKVFVNYNFTPAYSTGSTISQLATDSIAPSNISGLTAVQDKDTIKVLWTTNPNDSDFAGCIGIYKEGNIPIDRFDGIQVFNGNTKSFVINGLDKSKNYGIRIIPYDTSNNYNNSNTGQTVLVNMDSTPPSDLASFTSIAYSGSIRLKIQDPTGDWKGTMIRRSTIDYPQSITDGALVIDYQTKDLYKNGYIDAGLQNSQIYYYSAFPYNSNLNYNTSLGTNNKTTSTPLSSAVPEGLNFEIINTNNGNDIKVNWQNSFAPQGTNWQGRVLFVSNTTDLDGKDFSWCSTNATSLTNASGTGQGMNDTFTQSSVTIGTTYNYRLFMKYDVGYSAGVSLSILAKDTTPPSDVLSLTVLGNDNNITIQYTDPNDLDFDKSIIVVTKNGYQNSDYTGLDIIYKEEATKDKYKTIPLSIDGLINGQIYYVAIYPKDTNGNINRNIINRVQAIPLPLQAYGIEIDPTTNTITRLALSVGKVSSDFSSIYPYNQIKRCMLKADGTVNYYLLSTDSSKKADTSTAVIDGTDGDICVEIPVFYYKSNKTADGKIQFWISDTQLAGFYPHPMFARTTIKNKVYVGAFEGYVDNNSKLRSLPNKTPSTNKTLANLRSYATNLGSTFSLLDYSTLSGLQLLYLISYANGNSQTQLGKGVVNTANVVNTGQTLNYGNRCTSISDSSDGTKSISFYGIENIFSNTFQLTDGIVATDNYWFIANSNYNSFVNESSYGTYTKINSIPLTTSGFIKNVLYDTTTMNYGFLPSDVSGSDSTGFADMYWNGDNGNNWALSGGKYNSDTQAGIFALTMLNESIVGETHNMTNEGVVGNGTQFSYTIDKSMFTTPHEIGSLSIVDGTTPQLQINYNFTSAISARLMKV